MASEKPFRPNFEALYAGPAGKGVFPGERTDVDHVATSALPEYRQNFVTAIVGAGKIEADHALPLFGSQVGHAAENAGAGVVDQNVDGAEAVVAPRR